MPYSSANITGNKVKGLLAREKSMNTGVNTVTAMEGEGSTCFDEETAYADAALNQDQIKSQVQFSDVELAYHGRGNQRPVTADHTGTRQRVHKIGTDVIFKRFEMKNPSGILGECNINTMSFTTAGTFNNQHQKLMSKVDQMIKQQNLDNLDEGVKKNHYDKFNSKISSGFNKWSSKS